ncbi:MAG: hypothetical protein R3D33_11725 [Hyphomicrobiaceae bacterium]
MIVRTLASWMLLVAVIALVADGTIATAHGSFVATTVIGHWKSLAPASLAAAETLVSARISPALWDPVLLSLLRLPTFAFFGGLGLLLFAAGRKRRRVNIYAN